MQLSDTEKRIQAFNRAGAVDDVVRLARFLPAATLARVVILVAVAKWSDFISGVQFRWDRARKRTPVSRGLKRGTY